MAYSNQPDRAGEVAARYGPRRAQVLGVVAVVLLAVLLPACRSTATDSTPPGATTTATAAPATTTATVAPTTASGYSVQVFFSRHPDSDNDPSKVFPVKRTAPNLQVATYATTQLIAGPTASEQSQGYFTPLSGALGGSSNCGGADFTITLNMRGTKPEPGTATLRFCRTVSLAGDLTGAYISSEIDATLLQFATIKKVVILTVDGGCFDDLSGQNLCLQ
jgi:hypothetical protein